MLPMIVRSTAEALTMVPDDMRAAAYGLGAHDSEAVIRIVLPAARSGITTGLLLAIARATGETAPLVLTVLFSPFLSFDITKPMATLSVLIYNFGSMPYQAQQAMAWTASLVLVAVVLMLNIGIRLSMSMSMKK
jgi:phosphate transport system permease protein